MPTPAQPVRAKKSAHAAALGGLLLCLAFAYLLFHSLAGGTLLSPNPYDSYTLQAVNWLQGRLDIAHGETYAWLELALYKGRYYQSFPPVPAAVLLPLAAVFGTNAPSNLVIALFGLLCAAGVYVCFAQRGFSASWCAFFALFATMGSNFFWLSTAGDVWFLAQVFGLCFAVWGIALAADGRAPQTAGASLCFGLAVGCRPFFALLAVCWLASLPQTRRAPPRPCLVLAALVPLTAAGLAMAAYNAVRFGNPLEFGHSYLPEFTRAANGQFSLRYLPANLLGLLRPVTLNGDASLRFPLFNGFLPFAANPLFALWAADAAAARRRPRACPAPQSEAPAAAVFPFPRSGWLLLGGCLLVLLATCAHKTMGGWQFGARYTVDLLVWPLLWYLGRGPQSKRPGAAAHTLLGLAVLFNLYGAVFMLKA